MGALTELSLFSGYGGFTLGLRLAGVEVQTACYVEWDKYCQQILTQRISEGHLDDAPIWDDITTFDGGPWRGHVDIITGGFPCQPHSTAGKRLGKEDSRNLWPDTLRVIREVEPSYVLLENVRGLVDGTEPYVAEVLGSLSEAGYDAVWGLFSAQEAGAPHKRERWWCLAYTKGKRAHGPEYEGKSNSEWHGEIMADTDSNGEGRHQPADGEGSGVVENDCVGDSNNPGIFAYTSGIDSNRSAQNEGQRNEPQPRAYRPSWWAVEPDVGRVAHGVAHRVDRLKALGNGIVPAVVAEFLNAT